MKKTVCVDLDGVLADYSKGWQGIDIIGDPIPGAVEFTKELTKFANVVVYTTRCKTFAEGEPGPEGQPEVNRSSLEVIVKFVTDWLQKWDIPYDEVYGGQGKPFAVAYVGVMQTDADSGSSNALITASTQMFTRWLDITDGDSTTPGGAPGDEIAIYCVDPGIHADDITAGGDDALSAAAGRFGGGAHLV